MRGYWTQCTAKFGRPDPKRSKADIPTSAAAVFLSKPEQGPSKAVFHDHVKHGGGLVDGMGRPVKTKKNIS